MVRKWVMVSLLVFAGMLPATARGDEIGDLRKELESQYNQLMQMQNRLMALEAAQQQAAQMSTLSPGGEFKLPESLAWVEKVKLYGDFRYRFETIDAEGSDVRNRNRIRARLGMQFRVNEEMTFDLRLASGGWFDDDNGEFDLGGGPVSANETLDTYFSSKSIWLDRAYLTYQPNWADGLKVLAGKMSNPFYSVGKSQLIWDGDLNPEGVAVQYGMDLTESDVVFANAGTFFVEENASSSDVTLWGVQGGLHHAFNDTTKMTVGASYYDYMNIEGARPDVNPTGSTFGGNTLTGGVYAFDYNIVELFGEYATKVGDLPFAVFGNWVNNVASNVDGDTGWLAGVVVNKTRKPGDWAFSYDYRETEADAVLGVFNDSDFNGGGTDARGHRFGFDYMVLKNTTLGATYFCTEDRSTDDEERRLQLDVVVKF